MNCNGTNGRPVSPRQCLQHEPFLTVESEEPLTYDPEHRVDRPFERAVCKAAKRRSEVQVSYAVNVD